jgi:hypothetical protein
MWVRFPATDPVAGASVLSNGPVMVSTGQRVRIVALGKVEAVRVGDSRPKTTKKVNANDSQFALAA